MAICNLPPRWGRSAAAVGIEDSLRALGLKRFRVRHHGSIARIEVAEEEMAAILQVGKMKAMAAVVRAAGFRYVSLDCEGYRSGSMNEVLPIEVLTGFAK